MRTHIFGALAALFMIGGGAAQAATATLDFETAGTGANLVADGSVTTSLGTVTLDCSAGSCSQNGTLFFSETTDGGFAILTFDFAVTELVFDYAGNASGVFTAQAIDASNTIIDSFFDANTNSTLPDTADGTITLSGTGITALRFADTPGGGSFAVIDNLKITSAMSAVPLPAGLPLLVAGLMGFGVLRRRQRHRG